MATARQAYLASKLVEKYGVFGCVASRYVTAGYSARMLHPTRYGPVHIIAKKHGIVLAIDVVTENLTSEVAKKLLEKAKLLRARPVLVVYGKGVAVPGDVILFCRENGIKLKRVLSD